MSELIVSHNAEYQMFTAPVDDGTAHVGYSMPDNKVMELEETFVPPADRNHGIGSELIRNVLNYAKDHGYKIIPACPMVHDYIEKNERFQSLVLENAG